MDKEPSSPSRDVLPPDHEPRDSDTRVASPREDKAASSAGAAPRAREGITRRGADVPEPPGSPSADWTVWFHQLAGWVLLAIPFVIHLRLALANIDRGLHEELRPYGEMEGSGLEEWISQVFRLFVKPEVASETVRMYALWAIIFVAVCIYAAMRMGDDLPRGVFMFLNYGLGNVVLLLVLVPALWIFLGERGPTAVELAPPLVLGAVGAILELSTRSQMLAEGVVRPGPK